MSHGMQTINVWVNGCFDVLHRGHIELLKYAKSKGTNLVVGIDSDSRVKLMKGNNRPFNKENDRQYFLNSIKYVDKVVLFNSDQELKKHLLDNKIQVMVIGSDWKGKTVIGEDLVEKIVFFDRLESYSTTKILEGNKDL